MGMELFGRRVLTVLCLSVIVSGYALLKPVGADPDEVVHLIHAYCGDAGSTARCASVGTDWQLVPRRIGEGLSCLGNRFWAAAICQESREELGPLLAPKFEFGRYPGPLKRLSGAVIQADEERSVLLIRLIYAAMSLCCIGLPLLQARRNLLSIWIYLSLVLSPSSVSLIASVNPSGLSIAAMIGIGIFLIADPDMTWWYHGRWRMSDVICLGVPVSGLLLSRPDTVLFVLVALPLLLGRLVWISVSSTRRGTLILRSPKFLLCFVFVVIGSLFSIDGQLRRFLIFPQADFSREVSHFQWFVETLAWTPQLIKTALLGDRTGSYSTALVPPEFGILIFVVFVRIAIRAHITTGTKSQRAHVALGLLVVIPIYLHHLIGVSPLGSPIQPRYLTPYVALSLAVLISCFEYRGGTRTQLSESLIISAANVLVLVHNVVRYGAGVNPETYLSSLVSAYRLLIVDSFKEFWWQNSIPFTANETIFIMALAYVALFWSLAPSRSELVER